MPKQSYVVHVMDSHAAILIVLGADALPHYIPEALKTRLELCTLKKFGNIENVPPKS
jgi:hypothetical protein